MSNSPLKAILWAIAAFYLVTMLLEQPWLPKIIKVALVFALFFGICALVLSMLARSTGWGALAKQYPQHSPFSGSWYLCQTCHMSRVPKDDPAFQSTKTQLHSLVRVGTSADSLFLSSWPILRLLAPTVEIPWSAVNRLGSYEASGRVRSPMGPGTLFQLNYDPGFTGEFIELEISGANVYLQLPAATLACISLSDQTS